MLSQIFFSHLLQYSARTLLSIAERPVLLMVGVSSQPVPEEVKISTQILRNVLLYMTQKLSPPQGYLAFRTEFLGTPEKNNSQNPGLVRENQDKGVSLRTYNFYKLSYNPTYFDI
jgi:hypothetical protein